MSAPSRAAAPPLMHIVRQHAEEAASLYTSRRRLLSAPDVRLSDLARHDKRLVAHLDGLQVAGEDGVRAAEQALESPGAGTVFTAGVMALQSRREPLLQRLVALAGEDAEVARGLRSALGWVAPQHLRGTTKALLDAPSASARELGLAACAMHGVLPAATALAWAGDESAALRARALRYLGETAVQGGLAPCLRALEDEDARCRFNAARSAALLGNRTESTAALAQLASAPGAFQRQALCLLAQMLSVADAHRLLQPLAQQPPLARLLIQGMAAAGNPVYVPWLIRQMDDPKLTRVAGEAFWLVTGANLNALGLDRPQPEMPEPEGDEAIAMDEDDGLAWPDAGKVAAWWQRQGPRFSAGTRYFAGETLSVDHCLSVLRQGYQRQRRAAGEHLSLLQPGSVFFPLAAPAWRQERQLAPPIG